MITVYFRHDGQIRTEKIDAERMAGFDPSRLLWIDMVSPGHDEIVAVEEKLDHKFPTRQETEEIEFSARYFEDEKSITINTYFFVRHEANAYNETVSFTLKGNFLVTLRYNEQKIFRDFYRTLMANPALYRDGAHVLSGILGLRIEVDADILELLAKEIVGIGKVNLKDFDNINKFLEYITNYENINITLRENLTDKQRVLSSLLKSNKIHESIKKEFTMMIKDVNSLITTANFNFERLDYLQNLFLNFLGVEQNKVIKIFTVMSVIFLPPTLIASIYGMNFKIIPELDWQYGYALALILIVLSAVLPLYIFKKKGWL